MGSEWDPGRVVAVLASALVFLLAVWVVWPIAAPVLWAVLLGYLLWPLNARMRTLLRGRPSAAALLLSVGVLIGFVTPLVLIGLAFARQASDLAHRLAKFQTAGGPIRLPWMATAIHWVQTNLHIGAEELRQRATGALAGALEFLASRLGQVFVGAVGAVSGLALMLFVMFFLLRDGDVMMRAALAAVPFDEERKKRLVVHVGEITRGVVVGSFVTAVAQGALVGIAFAVLGLPSPVVFAVISAFVSVLPIGTALVWVPASLVLALDGRYGAAALLMLWGILVVSVVDNFIRPRIVSQRAKVPSLAVFLGIVGGIASFGLFGLVVGPVVLVLSVELISVLSKAPKETHTPTREQPPSVPPVLPEAGPSPPLPH